jgi:hypothetical protein
MMPEMPKEMPMPWQSVVYVEKPHDDQWSSASMTADTTETLEIED